MQFVDTNYLRKFIETDILGEIIVHNGIVPIHITPFLFLEVMGIKLHESPKLVDKPNDDTIELFSHQVFVRAIEFYMNKPAIKAESFIKAYEDRKKYVHSSKQDVYANIFEELAYDKNTERVIRHALVRDFVYAHPIPAKLYNRAITKYAFDALFQPQRGLPTSPVRGVSQMLEPMTKCIISEGSSSKEVQKATGKASFRWNDERADMDLVHFVTCGIRDGNVMTPVHAITMESKERYIQRLKYYLSVIAHLYDVWTEFRDEAFPAVPGKVTFVGQNCAPIETLHVDKLKPLFVEDDRQD